MRFISRDKIFQDKRTSCLQMSQKPVLIWGEDPGDDSHPCSFFGNWLHYVDLALQCLNPGGS